MALILDHVFCFCDNALHESRVLAEAGFNLTAGKRHHGQGTANRSVVFETNYLELIFLNSRTDAQANSLRLDRRADWRFSGSSPFGIALRGTLEPEDAIHFTEYRPPYNPASRILIHKFDTTQPDFPLLFVMPSTGQNVKFKDFNGHLNGSTNIAHVEVSSRSSWPLVEMVPQITVAKSDLSECSLTLKGPRTFSLEINETLRLAVR
ncbi:MAG: hypothetical protein EOP06_02485 [Proteobacteria bacterium]|nr:MAG: hypothetical protein EOP06_02485 [Pseudomonadota bacterium]